MHSRIRKELRLSVRPAQKRELLVVAIATLCVATAVTGVLGVIQWRKTRPAHDPDEDHFGQTGRTRETAGSAPLFVLRSEDTSALRVVDTVPLELGEGDTRSGTCEVRPKNGRGVEHVPVGTRIEQLEDDGRAPKGMRLIRVSTSRYHGLIGYAWAYQIQAAR